MEQPFQFIRLSQAPCHAPSLLYCLFIRSSSGAAFCMWLAVSLWPSAQLTKFDNAAISRPTITRPDHPGTQPITANYLRSVDSGDVCACKKIPQMPEMQNRCSGSALKRCSVYSTSPRTPICTIADVIFFRGLYVKTIPIHITLSNLPSGQCFA